MGTRRLCQELTVATFVVASAGPNVLGEMSMSRKANSSVQEN